MSPGRFNCARPGSPGTAQKGAFDDSPGAFQELPGLEYLSRMEIHVWTY